MLGSLSNTEKAIRPLDLPADANDGCTPGKLRMTFDTGIRFLTCSIIVFQCEVSEFKNYSLVGIVIIP